MSIMSAGMPSQRTDQAGVFGVSAQSPQVGTHVQDQPPFGARSDSFSAGVLATLKFCACIVS